MSSVTFVLSPLHCHCRVSCLETERESEGRVPVTNIIHCTNHQSCCRHSLSPLALSMWYNQQSLDQSILTQRLGARGDQVTVTGVNYQPHPTRVSYVSCIICIMMTRVIYTRPVLQTATGTSSPSKTSSPSSHPFCQFHPPSDDLISFFIPLSSDFISLPSSVSLLFTSSPSHQLT